MRGLDRRILSTVFSVHRRLEKGAPNSVSDIQVDGIVVPNKRPTARGQPELRWCCTLDDTCKCVLKSTQHHSDFTASVRTRQAVRRSAIG